MLALCWLYVGFLLMPCLCLIGVILGLCSYWSDVILVLYEYDRVLHITYCDCILHLCDVFVALVSNRSFIVFIFWLCWCMIMFRWCYVWIRVWIMFVLIWCRHDVALVPCWCHVGVMWLIFLSSVALLLFIHWCYVDMMLIWCWYYVCIEFLLDWYYFGLLFCYVSDILFWF
jgi:hypothetical protein